VSRWQLRIVLVAAFVGSVLVAPLVAQQVVRIYGTVSGTFLPVLVDTSGRLIVDVAGGDIEPDRVLLADGTVALPSLSFQSDPNTGWYWTSDGAVLMANNGVLTHQWGTTYYANSSNSACVQFGAAGDVTYCRGAAGQPDWSSSAGVRMGSTQTTDPTCTANCGTSPTVTGTDSEFTVLMGASGSPASGFVITFNGTWAAAPQCTGAMAKAGMAVGKLPLTLVTTTTTLTVVTNGTAPATTDLYHFVCRGGR
jgi:hypothetical protein